MNNSQLFILQFRREMLLHCRQPYGLLLSTLFFLMIVLFFPLTLSPDPLILRQVASGLLWVAMLLAMLMASERLFQQDYEDGLIEQWLTSGFALSVIIAAKVTVHWLLNITAILILCSLVALLFNLSRYETGILMVSLLVGTPTILYLCALAAAFTTSVQQKSALIALILLPLALPVMIFGSGTLNAAMQGQNITGYLAILLALSILAVTFLPLAISAIIRISLVD